MKINFPQISDNDFLKDLKNICTLVSEYEDFGWAGSSLTGHLVMGNCYDLMKRYPEANLRRGAFVVLKQLMKEERERIYDRKHDKTRCV